MTEISITEAAAKIRRLYGYTRDLALRGELRARRNEHGRIVIDDASVDAYLARVAQYNAEMARIMSRD